MLRRPSRVRGVIASVCMLATSASDLAAEDVTIVTDINIGQAGSYPSYLLVHDGQLYFRANNISGGNNTELWRFDGTRAEMVADISPGPTGSSPSYLTIYGGDLYFSARGCDSCGTKLWRYDGTEVALAPGSESGAGNPQDLVVYGDQLLFRAFRSGLGIELWKFDGSTQTPIDIFPGSGSSYPQHFIEFRGDLYFNAGVANDGGELWRYDGSGPELALNITDGYGSSPESFVVFGYDLYFSANDGSSGRELWRYNGITAERVADINEGPGSSNPSGMTVYRGAIYFCAEDDPEGTLGYELWRYDGTRTELVANINEKLPVPGVDPVHHSFPGNFFVFDRFLYFTADDGIHGRELWRYDGEAASLVADIWPGPNGSNLGEFVMYHDQLYFLADDGESGGELGTSLPAIWQLTVNNAPLNGDFESGLMAPWDLTGSGAVVYEDFFIPGIPPTSGQFMGYISTLNNEFLVSIPEAVIPMIDLDGNGVVEREFSSLAITVSTTQPAIASFDLNFLTDELLPNGSINDSDLFGVTTGTVIDGPYELLFAVASTDGSYSGTAEELTADEFTSESIEEIRTFGVFPTIIDSSQYNGQTGFKTYRMPISAGDHTLTFFVADSHTDGVASGMLIDNFSVTVVPEQDRSFRRGDSNSDGSIDVSDAILNLLVLFTGKPGPGCEKSLDTDDNGVLEITDAVYLLSYLFLEGAPPEPPFPTCGSDPTIDELTCNAFAGCPEP